MRSRSGNDAGISPERVKQIRQARHKATVRRRVLAAFLFVATVAVFVASLYLPFSALFSLIPAVLLLVVLILGARASKKARQWEHKLHERTRSVPLKSGAALHHELGARDAQTRKRPQSASSTNTQTAVSPSHTAPSHTSASRQSEQRTRRRGESATSQPKQTAQQSPAKQHSSQSTAAHNGAVTVELSKQKRVQKHSAVPQRVPAKETDRAAAKPKSSSRKQDLISFSLGSASAQNDEVKAAQAPQSLEIKSSRQVTKVKVKPIEPVTLKKPTADETVQVQDAAAATASDGAQQRTSMKAHAEKTVAPELPETKSDRANEQIPVSQAPREMTARTRQPAQVASAAPQGRDRVHAKPNTEAKRRSRRAAKSVQPLLHLDFAATRPAGLGNVNDHVASFADAAAFHDTETKAVVEPPAVSSDSLGTGLQAILGRRNAEQERVHSQR